MKIIAFYLPQFHTIPENDEWWGKGFTEWTNVRKAKSLFEGHYQPKVPLNNNYYDLLDDSVKVWQARIAKEYGIYGFCYYHYWYNGHMLLEKPMEQMLKNKDVDIPFCIWWCNQPWTKSWVGNDNKVLIAQKYGDEKEWIEHYRYLRQFFLDKRYISINNKPIIGIYQPDTIGPIYDIKQCWERLAREDGFNGVDLMCTIKSYTDVEINTKVYDNFDHFVEWGFALALKEYKENTRGAIESFLISAAKYINKKYEMAFGCPIVSGSLTKKIKKMFDKNKVVEKYDYDEIWNRIIALRPYSNKSIPGAFVNWDNTARYGLNGSLMVNDSAKKFEDYLSKQIVNAKKNYNCDIIFLQAWNEWAEWSVLEPEEKEGYSYLVALKNALINNREFHIDV